MTLRLHAFLAGCLKLLLAALLPLAPVGVKPASGGYLLFERAVSGHQANFPLAALGNFDYFAKIAPECCKATNRTFGFSSTGTGNDLRRFTTLDGTGLSQTFSERANFP